MADGPVKGIFIATPIYGGKIHGVTATAINQLVSVFTRLGLFYEDCKLDMCDIVHTRNVMLTIWYDSYPSCDYLLMIDNDMQILPVMVTQMLGLDKPVVGAIYRRREADQDDDIWSKVIGEPMDGDAIYPIERGCQQWKYVGGGVLMIKRETVTRMLKQFPELIDYKDPGAFKRAKVTRMLRLFDKMEDPVGRPLSEDYSFCERWRQCDGEIWAAVDYPIGHIGSFTYMLHAARDLGLYPKAVAAA